MRAAPLNSRCTASARKDRPAAEDIDVHAIVASSGGQPVRHQPQLLAEISGRRQQRHDLSDHLRRTLVGQGSRDRVGRRTAALRRIHRAIREPHHVVERSRLVGVHRNAEAEHDRHLAARFDISDATFAECLFDLAAVRFRVRATALRQHDEELVAPVAPDDCVRA